MTAYERYNSRTPSKDVRTQLLQEYFRFCEEQYKAKPESLNRKVPRAVFEEFLGEIGGRLQLEARRLAEAVGPVGKFLDDTPLPDSLQERLPREFRTFCLILNALKQWIAAEQNATDRYLLGGGSGAECRAVAEHCLVTGKQFDGEKPELHHPVRDGRPPIPLSEEGHDQIEGQSTSDDPIRTAIQRIKKTRSWVMLRRGCLDHLGREVSHRDDEAKARARSFANRACEATGKSHEELLAWLVENELGA